MLLEASQSKGRISMQFIFSNNSRFDCEREEHSLSAHIVPMFFGSAAVYGFALNNASTNSTTRMGLGM